MLPGIICDIIDIQNNIWFTRVVPNKYPALSTEQSNEVENKGIYLAASAFGRHEVVIESPFHNQDIPDMSLEQVKRLLDTYAQRHKFLFNKFKDIANIIIFRNHGTRSGTSMLHPHSQIIATAVLPEYVKNKENIAKNYFEKTNRCPLCVITNYEQNDAKRLIYENASFLCFVPFASEVPFEIWISPKRHTSDFGKIDEYEKRDLAKALMNILSALKEKLDDPDYNYIIHSCSQQNCLKPYIHWHMQIRPRTTTPAGFEIGSGIHINVSLPEDNAKTLRKVIRRR